jgi:hypothetical protein
VLADPASAGIDPRALNGEVERATADYLSRVANSVVTADAAFTLLLVPPAHGVAVRAVAELREFTAPADESRWSFEDQLAVLAAPTPHSIGLRHELLEGRAGPFLRQTSYAANPGSDQAPIAQVANFIWWVPTLELTAVLVCALPTAPETSSWVRMLDSVAVSMHCADSFGHLHRCSVSATHPSIHSPVPPPVEAR